MAENENFLHIINDKKLPLIALLFVVIIFAALFMGGADPTRQTLTFSSLIFAATFLLTIATAKNGVPALFLVMAVAGLVWPLSGLAGNWYVARTEMTALWAGAAIWLAGYFVGQDRTAIRTVWDAIIWAGLIFALFAFVRHLAAEQGLVRPELVPQPGRLSASFGSPNTAATLFGMLTVLSVSRIIENVQKHIQPGISRAYRLERLMRQEYAAALCTLLSLCCLFLTESRGGVLITTGILLLMVIFEASRYFTRRRRRLDKPSPRRLKRLDWIAAYIVLFLLFSFIFAEFALERSDTAFSDVGGRTGILSVYWPSVMESPWIGHGLGSFNRINDAIISLSNAGTTETLGAAHNVVLQWLMQQGIIGLAFMIGIVAWNLTILVTALRQHSNRDRSFQISILSIAAIVLLHGMIDYALEIPAIMWLFAFLLGIAIGQAKLAKAHAAEAG